VSIEGLGGDFAYGRLLASGIPSLQVASGEKERICLLSGKPVASEEVSGIVLEVIGKITKPWPATERR
jgi:hypothetical protein